LGLPFGDGSKGRPARRSPRAEIRFGKRKMKKYLLDIDGGFVIIQGGLGRIIHNDGSAEDITLSSNPELFEKTIKQGKDISLKLAVRRRREGLGPIKIVRKRRKEKED